MRWTVTISKKANKQLKKLPGGISEEIRAIVNLLMADIAVNGPVVRWKNYSKLTNLGTNYHHCHIKDGRPSYIAIWVVLNAQSRKVEITHVSTRENAPY